MEPDSSERGSDKYQSRAEFLKFQLSDRIASYQRRRKVNRRWSFSLKIAGTSFSALITILLGLQGISGATAGLAVKNVALALSAVVTVIAVWESFFDHRGLWIRYTDTVAQLKRLLARLEYATAGCSEDPTREQLDELFARYQEILEKTNSSWLRLREETSKTSFAGRAAGLGPGTKS